MARADTLSPLHIPKKARKSYSRSDSREASPVRVKSISRAETVSTPLRQVSGMETLREYIHQSKGRDGKGKKRAAPENTHVEVSAGGNNTDRISSPSGRVFAVSQPATLLQAGSVVNADSAVVQSVNLPYDIRDMIYRECLSAKRKIEIGENGRSKWNHGLSLHSLRVAKLINEETAYVLYGNNVFRIEQATNALAWLTDIGPSNVGMLKRLDISPSLEDENGKEIDTDLVPTEWIHVFDTLAVGAPCLTHLSLYSEAFPFYGGTRTQKYRCFGMNICFIRALAQLQNVRSFDLWGTCPVLFRQYMEKKMDVKVNVGKPCEQLGYERDAIKLLWPKEEIASFEVELESLGLGSNTLHGPISVKVRVAF